MAKAQVARSEPHKARYVIAVQHKDAEEQEARLATPANDPAVMADFVLVELRAGLALAAFARHSLQKYRFLLASIQKAAAIHAHEVALKFLSQANPTREQQAMIEKQLSRLQDRISSLEKLPQS